MPNNSLLKFTAHEFKKYLSSASPDYLEDFRLDKSDRLYQCWKRDPLAVPVSSEIIFFQKLEYIHFKAASPKWMLCSVPEEYKWSSARFYFDGYDEFGILTHIRDADRGE